MMNKSLFLDALDKKNRSGMPPLWELEFHLWGKFGKGRFCVGFDFEKLSHAQKERALQENVETMAAVCDLLSFSAVTAPGGYWEVAPGIPAWYYLPEEYRLRQIDLMKRHLGDDVAIVVNVGGVMAMPEAHEYMDFSIKLMTEPDQIDEIARAKFQNALPAIDWCSDHGVDVVLTASDIADGHGLYFSPEQLDRYVFPYLDRWADYAHARQMRAIMHTDGNINAVVDRIAACGVDGLQAIDSTAHMDIVDLAGRYRDALCVCGNVDCGLLLQASAQEVYEATLGLARQLHSAPNFVLGASNALQVETPAENYLALVQAARTCRDSAG